jgi:hypothetical protein
MGGRRNSTKLTIIWLLIPIVAAVEVVSLCKIQNQEPTDEDWTAAARAIALEKQDHDLVLIAPKWATQGRMFLQELITIEDFGRFDTTLYDRVFEVSVNGARSPKTKGRVLESEQDFGNLMVRRYRLPKRAQVVYDFVSNFKHAKQKNMGKTKPIIVIDHWFNPRLSLPISLKKRKAILEYTDVPLGDTLRGYGIIGYRSGRFDQGRPVTITVYLDNTRLGSDTIRNFGPLKPFEFKLPKKSTGNIRFEIEALDGLKREFAFVADIRKPGKDR